MKFYNREPELQELETLFRQIEDRARMVVLTGRRRVGKTLLSLEFTRNHKFLYFFVAKKSEPLLCQEYLEEIKKNFDFPIFGEVRSVKEIFSILLEIARQEQFTLIFDEFQEFFHIQPSVYSDIQHLWDINRDQSKLNVIFVGSVFSLMNKIFQNSKEPLFGRADRILFLKPFTIPTLHSILQDYGIKDSKALFDFYVITGGMPKYLDILLENKTKDFASMLAFMARENSPFLEEGKNLLIEEFGREYGTYFSILELISIGKTSRNEIESLLEKNVGGYLERLEKDYSILSRHKPFNAKPNARQQKFLIVDNFLQFWFRFFYRHRSAIETGNFLYIQEYIQRDYSTYCGRVLEKYYQEILAGTNRYNRIGSYWERGNQNEIDIVAVNDMKKEILFAEVKPDKSRIDLEKLKKKSTALKEFSDYKKEWLGLSPEDVFSYLTLEQNMG